MMKIQPQLSASITLFALISLFVASAQAGVMEADLSITKSDGVVSAVPGGQVTYTIVASNAGPLDVTAASVQDTFPADLSCNWTCAATAGSSCSAMGVGDIADSIDLLASGAATFTAVCDVDSAATGTLSNTATISSTVTDPVPGNNSATDNDTVLSPEADLSVTKTDGLVSATPGGSLTYTIVVDNAGPSDDPAATLADVLPAELTCTYTSVAAGGASGNTAAGAGDLSETLSLPNGASVTYTLVCDIDSGATGTLSNTATTVSSVTDTNPANNSATDDDTVLDAEVDLSVTKSDGLVSATPGGSLTYTIVVANAGPSDDPAATLVDVLPAELTCTYTSVAAGGASGNTAAGAGDLNETLSLPSGSSVTYTVPCDIDSGATGTLSNTATASSSVTDTNLANNSATDDDTALGAEVDLIVTKTDGLVSAAPGESLTYTIVVSNSGPSDDPAATLVDVLPAELTCTYTSVAAGGASGNTAAGAGDLNETLSLPNGASVTYTVPCDIDSAAGNITLSNTAAASSSAADTNPANNSATDDTVLTREVDLSVTKTDGVTFVAQGGTLTYTIVASNAGPSDEVGAQLVDNLPADLTCTYTSAAAGGASGNAASGSGNLNEFLDLPVGSTVTYTLDCNVDAAATGTLSNTVTIAGSPESDTSNNSATDGDTTVTGISLSSGTNPSNVGDPVTFNYTVTGNGPTGNVTVSDGGAHSCTDTVGAGACDITFNSPGSFTMTASYAGDGNNAAVTSAAVDQVVGANDTALMITGISEPSPVLLFTPVTVTVDLDIGTSTLMPTGTITVTDGTNSCIITLPALSCSLSFTTPGAIDLIATYSGDANFNPSTSAIFTLVGQAVVPLPVPVNSPWVVLSLMMLMLAFVWQRRTMLG